MKKIYYLVWPAFLIFSLSVKTFGQVVINEISNANGSTISTGGETYDWIELYNAGSSSVNLLNYTLTDNPGEPGKWVFPSISIGALSYKLIFASALDTVISGKLHTNFKISYEGETIILSNSSGSIIDQYDPGNLQNNHSVGRKPDGSAVWCLFNSPSPDATNNNAACYDGYEADPVFSLNAGFYSGTQSTSLYTPSSTGVIRYTVNGGIPSLSSNLYSSPVTINATTVVSAKSYSTGNRLPSRTVKRTYFINENDLDLPVFSITTDSLNLWDPDTGIYVMGPNASSTSPYFGANFWQDWERVCHVEYFDKQKNKQFELQAGLKIRGGYSRAFPQKSFKIKARNKYGTPNINYPLIPDKGFITEFKDVVLRNGGSDFYKTRFRDAFMQNVVKDEHVEYMAYEPCLVFLNGEYWGQYEIREQQDENYIEDNHGIPAEKVDFLSHEGSIWTLAGSSSTYYTMHNFITTSNPQDPGFYSMASEMLDMENFADYFITQTYYVNKDWIGDWTNNIRLWHSQLPGGKWRYILWDLDFGLGLYSSPLTNMLARARNPNDPNEQSEIFSAMLNNTTFKNYFVNRYADLMNTNFQVGNMQKIAYEMRDSIISSMPRHINKWGNTYSEWYDAVNYMVNFNITRITNARNHIQSELNLNGQVDVTLTTSPPNAGRIQISTIIPDSLPWTGVYFDGVPVTLTAIPNPGFDFQHWGTNGVILTQDPNQSITKNINSDNTFTAHFTGSAVTPKLTFSEINYHSAPLSDAGDWLELHNYGNISINLSGWHIKDSVNSNVFQIPFGIIIPPNGYVVFSCDTQKFISQHPGVNYIGQVPFNFKNSGDELRLFSYDNSLYLSVYYSDKSPWPSSPDGKGKTLELMNPEVSLNLGTNWFAGCPGGSPGKAFDSGCPTTVPEVPSDSFHLVIAPNPSSGAIVIDVISDNNDALSFEMYDVMGKKIRQASALQNKKIVINRDGLRSGIYIIKVGSETHFITKKIIFQ